MYNTQNACKVVVVVYSMEQAYELEQFISNALNNANENIEELLRGTSDSLWKMKYKVRTVSASGDISLSISLAKKVQRMNREQLIQTLTNLSDTIRIWNEQNLAMEVLNFVKSIDKKKEYVYTSDTGNSYRVTYFDTDSNSRKQVSVGNVLIVVGDGNIIMSEQRKQRADKRMSPILTIDSRYLSTKNIYLT